MGVDRGRRCEADRFPDLAHGRGVAMSLDIGRQEVENLALPLGEHWASFREHVFDRLAARADGVKHTFAFA
jgi:hypothetical protein